VKNIQSTTYKCSCWVIFNWVISSMWSVTI